MRWLYSLLILLVAVQCQTTPSPTPTVEATATLEPPPVEQDIFRVGIYVWPDPSFSPPAFRGGSNAMTGGALNGFEVELAHLLAEGLGRQLELVEAYPPVIRGGEWGDDWDAAIASLVPFDGSPLRYSEPYGYMPMGILIPATAEGIESFDDLSGRSVGVLADSGYHRLLQPGGESLTAGGRPLLAEIPPDIEPVPLDNLPKAIRELEPSPLEAIFGPAPMLRQAMRQGLPVRFARYGENIGAQPLAIATTPQNEQLLPEINAGLELLRQQGTLAELYIRWYQQDLSRPP